MKKFLISLLAAGALTAWADSPRYIFYYIGDGMGMGPSVAAEMYNRQVLGNDTPITMMQFPVASFCLTYSASSPVTDSAAAGTALSTGVKTRNGMLGVNPDSVPVYSIARALQSDGYGIGVVTSVAPDDATPGAFYAHVPHRSHYYDIGVQAAESGYQFIAGSGLRGLTTKNGDPTDLLQVMEENNVQVVYGRDGMAKATGDKILLVSDEGSKNWDIGYTIDSIPGALTLPFITESCLNHLEKMSPDKFFMMVEGGNIDHALHANDGGAAIKEVLNFNEALEIAYQFYKQHPEETLIVVTADHDTGGLAIGNKHTGYNAHLDLIDYQKVSKEGFQDYCHGILKSRQNYTWDDMKQYLIDNFGFWKYVPVNEKQTKNLEDKFIRTFELRNSEDQKTLYANFNAFAVEVFKVFNDCAGCGFITTSHTGNPVPVFAVGVGADRFKSLNNNIEIPKTILDLVNGK